MSIGEVQPPLIEAAIANLNRRYAWNLQGHHAWPALLQPTRFMCEADLEAVFSGRQFLDERTPIVRTIECEHARVSVSVRLMDKEERFTFQVWKGRQTRQNTSVLGRIGSVKIVCERIEDAIAAIVGRNTATITIGALARYISEKISSTAGATDKLLNRINRGFFVTEVSVARVCEVLGIRTTEITFDAPIIYQAANRTRKPLQPVIWAERWNGWETSLYKLIIRDKSPCTTYFQTLIPTDDAGVSPEVRRALSAIYKAVEISRRLFPEDAIWKLRDVSEDLDRADLSAWVSYLPGSGDRDPEGRSRLFITIDTKGAAHRFIRFDNILPFVKENSSASGDQVGSAVTIKPRMATRRRG